MADTTRPVTILISALGGEGGGVMTDWIIAAAREQNLICQATSVPGVAQRTGATTYYLEVFRDKLEPGKPEPVMALYPQAGDIDLMVASELAEAGRACQNGFVTPDRTTLITSTHRFYLLDEKMGMADSRLDAERLEKAVRAMAKRVIAGDFVRAAREAGTVINAVLLGAMAGSGLLPMPVEAFERAIRSDGKAVEANMRGFHYGLSVARGEVVELAPKTRPLPAAPQTAQPAGTLLALRDRVARDFPPATHEIVIEGVARVVDFQDFDYGKLYLDRLAPILAADGGDYSVTRETARYLALWMAYEDVIRVAQLKTRLARLERVRAGSGGKAEQPVIVTEFLKPGLDEFCSLLPASLAAPLLRWADRTGRRDAFNVGLHIRTSTVLGFALLRMMAKLKAWRRRGYRFGVEQALIARWLAAVEAGLTRDPALGREIAECARLIKGYSDTHRRGQGNFLRLMDTIVDPTLARPAGPDTDANAAAALATARKAALADPEGNALGATLEKLGRVAVAS
ncbi:MAG TPA: indolepyruvate oxidoreductase subunit beta family protein [Xanthobacteraceae bacterium]|nr:indolepyruvate oxidoreductase subunit beta family protein [Xanthobacteraceae bacterium]